MGNIQNFKRFKQTVIAGQNSITQRMAIYPPTAIYDSLLFSLEGGELTHE